MIVYLLECVNEDQTLYKIGHTKNSVKKRIEKLQTGNPHKIREIARYESFYAQILEKTLHRNYSYCRKNGEWFLLEIKEVANFLKNCERIEKNFELLKDNPFFK